MMVQNHKIRILSLYADFYIIKTVKLQHKHFNLIKSQIVEMKIENLQFLIEKLTFRYQDIYMAICLWILTLRQKCCAFGIPKFSHVALEPQDFSFFISQS